MDKSCTHFDHNRHSDATPTTNAYRRFELLELESAIAKPPDIHPATDPETKTPRATGSDYLTIMEGAEIVAGKIASLKAQEGEITTIQYK
ncbi:MAG: hypothetical protein LBU23_06990, partial [Planctomycetota bacterium]|jgi:hypothetical protein|nr:hypothetical protein [Planctomycetota bacterium]